MPTARQHEQVFPLRVTVHGSRFDHAAFTDSAVALCGRQWQAVVSRFARHRPLCGRCRAVAGVSGLTVPR